MTIDIINVMDTAVKIGLGALIGGAFSYFMSVLKHRQEMQKQKYEQKIDSLKEVSDSFQKSQSGTNKFISLISVAINHGEDDLKDLEVRCKEALDHSFQFIASAYSLANLIGFQDLHSSLQEYSNIISEMDGTTDSLRSGVPCDADFLEPIINKAHETEKVVYLQISKAYEACNA